MTGNQKMAFEVLGFVPAGYVMVCRNIQAPYNAGIIFVNGKPFASFKI